MLSALWIAQMFLQLHDSSHKCQKGAVVGVTLDVCPNSLCCGKHVCVTVLSRCGGATVPWGVPRAGATADRDLCSFSLWGLLPLVGSHPSHLPHPGFGGVTRTVPLCWFWGFCCLLTVAFSQFEVGQPRGQWPLWSCWGYGQGGYSMSIRALGPLWMHPEGIDWWPCANQGDPGPAALLPPAQPCLMPIKEVLRSSNSQLKQSRGRSGTGDLNSFHPIINTSVEPYFSPKMRSVREIKPKIHLYKIYLWDLSKSWVNRDQETINCLA